VNERNEVNGINNDLLDKLIIDLTKYMDSINSIFNSIDEEVNKSYELLPSPVVETFKLTYEVIKENYSLVNYSIQSYCTDYAKVKVAYSNRDFDIANQVKKFNSNELNRYVEEGR